MSRRRVYPHLIAPFDRGESKPWLVRTDATLAYLVRMFLIVLAVHWLARTTAGLIFVGLGLVLLVVALGITDVLVTTWRYP